MITTLMHNTTSDRFVSRVSTTPNPMSSTSFAVSHAGAPVAVTSPTNRWLGGFDGLGCDGTETAYGTKRILPGRLGGVT